MNNRILLIVGIGLLALLLPATQRQFVGMTLASLAFLFWVPDWFRHHVGKIETYHHEISHGLASILSGGKFHKFHIHPRGGGVALTQGGRRHLIIAAGYIGSVLFGAIYLARSAQTDSITVLLYLVALLYALSVLKAGDRHTRTVGIAFASIVGILSILSPGSLLTRLVLNLIGVILVYEGFRSLWTLHLISATHTGTGSDAESMAELHGGHPIYWSTIFSVIAVVLLAFVLTVVFTTL